MVGAEDGDTGLQARGQFHPATVHWRQPDGGGRLAPGRAPRADHGARARERRPRRSSAIPTRAGATADPLGHQRHADRGPRRPVDAPRPRWSTSTPTRPSPTRTRSTRLDGYALDLTDLPEPVGEVRRSGSSPTSSQTVEPVGEVRRSGGFHRPVRGCVVVGRRGGAVRFDRRWHGEAATSRSCGAATRLLWYSVRAQARPVRHRDRRARRCSR